MTTPTQTSTITSTTTEIGGLIQQYLWNYQDQQFPIIYETLGQGHPVLLLPAFSTVSTRAEMAELAKLLASQFQVVVVDWLGFGQSARPTLDYRPEIYHQFLQDFVQAVFDRPIAVVAAGHAAGYVMKLAQQMGIFSCVVLVAPTWRGPLPSMGADRSISNAVRQGVRSPLLGQALYKLNTTPAFLSMMYRSHVYADPAKVTPEFVDRRWQSTQQPGARFAPAAFVTGALDPTQTREEFLAWFQPLPMPILVAIAKQAPPKSKAEMTALGDIPGVEMCILPGSLGLHEENPDSLAAVVLPFLHKNSSNP